MRVEDGFQTEKYELPEDVYAATRSLNAILRRILPAPVLEHVEADLHRFSKRLGNGDITEVGRFADGPSGEPRLVQYDHYGRRVDRLETSEGWRNLKRIAAEEGIVGISYERETGEYARVHAFAKIYLWVGDSRVIGCPMSMTDGAARVLEEHGTPEMKASVLPRLITRDASKAWTAGQFMTEKSGGSDVSRTETTAVRAPGQSGTVKAGDLYILDGFKWFSSATDGEIALALARTGTEASGSSGLSLFLLPLKSQSLAPGPSSPPSNNGIHIHRLKSKIGTKAVPTAELSLAGTRGFLVGELGSGVRTIATVLNITRMHSAFHALGSVGRALMIATSYAAVRQVRDSSSGAYVPLSEVAIHTSMLAPIALLHHALLHLLLPLAHLLGKSETGHSTAQDAALLRLLTPVAKAFAGVRASPAVQTCIEALGGLGYMEEEPLGRLMRDSLVERIWEGTSSVLALDVCRVVVRSGHAVMGHYYEWANDILDSSTAHPAVAQLRQTLAVLRRATLSLSPSPSPSAAHTPRPDASDPRVPRALLDVLGHTTASLGMVQQANWASRTAGEEGEAELEWEMMSRWMREGEGAVRELGRLVGARGEGRGEELRMEREIVYGRTKL